MTREQIQQAVDEASKALKSFPKGPMGMTPDAVKSTPEFKQAKANYQRAFTALRNFNSSTKVS